MFRLPGLKVRCFASGLAIAFLLSLSACANVAPTAPDAKVSDEDLAEFNQLGNTAADDPARRSRSGNSSRFAVAIDAVILHDRNKTHYFFSDLRRIARDFHEGYIDEAERTELVWKAFSNRGVLLNRHYLNKGGEPLLRLRGEYQLSETAVEVLRAMYPGGEYELPSLSTVSSRRDGLGNNYVFFDMAVINPPGIRKVAAEIGLGDDLESMFMTVALHESVHHIHRQIMGRGKFRTYSEKMGAINDAVAGLGIRFGHWTSVEEFLADAVAIQSGSTAIRFVASRILRAPNAADKLVPSKKRRVDPHDASARFMYVQLEARDKSDGVDIETLRKLQKKSVDMDSAAWEEWVEYSRKIFDEDFEGDVRDAYFDAASKILKILFGTTVTQPLT